MVLEFRDCLGRKANMRDNGVKQALRDGGIVFGSELSGLRSPEVARLYAAAGFDFVFIDMEHSPFSLETVADLVRAARQAGIVPIVRVPQAEYVWIARVLDNGAQGVIVPRVSTPAQVREIVSWTQYPPLGIRGYACTTSQSEGAEIAPKDFIERVHANTLLVIQIERQEGVDNLEEMLSIPGVDVACLGCLDLSVDLGVPGELNHPRMVEAIQRVVDVAESHGLASGIIVADMAMIDRWVGRGMRFVSYATDALLLREAAMHAVERLRSLKRE